MAQKNRIILIIIVVIALLSILAYLYLWYADTNKLRQQAAQQIDQAQQFTDLTAKIELEKTRCQQFISQESGQFNEFQYCQKFIDWTNTIQQ